MSLPPLRRVSWIVNRLSGALLGSTPSSFFAAEDEERGVVPRQFHIYLILIVDVSVANMIALKLSARQIHVKKSVCGWWV